MQIQRAGVSDCETLSAIARAAKGYWGYPERWLALWREALTLTPEFVSENQVHAAVERGEVLGFYALVVERERARLEHLWVAPEHIGKGVGRRLFEHGVALAGSLGAASIEIDSDPNAEEFYLKLGARRVGETSADRDGQLRVLPQMRFELK